jgi:hypothetical protein
VADNHHFWRECVDLWQPLTASRIYRIPGFGKFNLFGPIVASVVQDSMPCCSHERAWARAYDEKCTVSMIQCAAVIISQGHGHGIPTATSARRKVLRELSKLGPAKSCSEPIHTVHTSRQGIQNTCCSEKLEAASGLFPQITKFVLCAKRWRRPSALALQQLYSDVCIRC